ncbi:Bacteriophage P2 Baseplate assembly protein GPV [Cupriavidus taiwanensis]|uniref:Bacteriophage P2 Baseplate assembly protein GPV n=1 Tax=Cupriavidus taiwanensis TaxID=164546 RepID=A0A375IE27_9BURK|nr:phage baseplate assembly protein V [Cupriavidus taiwanensis]SPK73053.1 Bacteriophage P2 Baseplate assembly protein GPV [Cupriavidus taiwanensis]
MDSATELARLIENLIRLGTIAEVDTGSPPRVRVKAGGMTTDWLPWLERRAGATRTWNPPTVGEQVVLLCPSGELRNGVILTGVPTDANDVPSHSASETVTLYPDGAITRYNHVSGALDITGVQTVVLKASQTVVIDCPDTVFKGKVTVEKLFTYLAGMAGEAGAAGAKTSIKGAFTHTDGELSSNGVVLDSHDHGGVQRGGERTDGPQ